MTAAPTHAAHRPGSSGRIVGGLAVKNLRKMWRTPIVIIMAMAYPVGMYVLFATVFNQAYPTGLSYAAISLPAMATLGIMSNCLFNLSIDVTNEREEGFLRRLALLPCPAWAFLTSKIISSALITALCMVVLILTGALALGVALPTSPAAWGLILLVCLLTTAYCAAIGIALGRTLRTSQVTLGVVLPIFIIIPFISGLFLPMDMLPSWLVNAASVLPVRWSTQLLRQGFLPDALKSNELGGAWNTGLGLAVLTAWVVIGVVWAIIASRRDTFDR